VGDVSRFVIGSSLKMYFGHKRTLEWVRAVADICAEHPATVGGTVQFFVIPTFPSIPGVVEIARPAGIAVGAQDLHWEDAGPFTGEVSGAELAELGCSLVEIGHAERRTMFGETDQVVARKTLAALRNGLSPMPCVGEPEPGAPSEAAAFCIRQLEAALAPARASGTGGQLVVAY
jgi:triosephosphate isomerase